MENLPFTSLSFPLNHPFANIIFCQIILNELKNLSFRISNASVKIYVL